MAEPTQLIPESAAVQKHVDIMQGVITRMAENSRSCKVWCVTLVSAILVLVARTGEPQHAFIALTPSALFWVLDAYYLAQERAFRQSYSNFIGELHSGDAMSKSLYAVAQSGSVWRETLWAMFRSFSVSPFYAVIVATVLLAWKLIL